MKGKRVFVLDDEESVVFVVSEVLKLAGFEVASSRNPVPALEVLESTDFDLLVVDLMMPRLTGEQVIERLRDSERHRETPIIVLSTKRLSSDERKILNLHRVVCLAKPFSNSRLCEVAGECIERRARK